VKEPLYQVPANKKIRVIIDTDTYAEGDDQYAIVHALLTPKFDVIGIVAEHFGNRFENTMEKSYDEIKKVLGIMDCNDIPVFRGEVDSLTEASTLRNSEGVKFIIEQALLEDERPLFVLNMGAVTNLSAAYLMNPDIAKNLIAIWIGGGPYDKAIMDFNAGNDVIAANILIGSDIELWQIPMSAYTMMEVSFHELYYRVKPFGAIGNYIFENLLKVSDVECAKKYDYIPMVKNASKGAKSMLIRSGEGWSLGDSPAVGVLITSQAKNMEIRRAQYIDKDGSYKAYVSDERMIRVYHSIDSRIILEDFFAKIRYNFE
jgi:purine nucleosidase